VVEASRLPFSSINLASEKAVRWLIDRRRPSARTLPVCVVTGRWKETFSSNVENPMFGASALWQAHPQAVSSIVAI